MGKVAMELGVMRRHGSGPGGAMKKSLGNEEGFAPSRNGDAIIRAGGSLAAEFGSDFAIDFGGNENSPAGFGWKISEAG
jgi:hypothetical protein